MKQKTWRLFLGGGVLAFTVASSSAPAHIRLTQPTSRYAIPATEDGSFLKEGPCGGGDDTRTTDPARISTFAPGETITVQWHETVHHESHYRIAFDDEGQDAFVDPADEADIVEPPVLPILLDGIMDKSDATDSFSVQVTLPMTPCENCTLQLIQYMYGRQQPMYYQCADIVIDAGQAPAEPALGVGGDGTGGGASEQALGTGSAQAENAPGSTDSSGGAHTGSSESETGGCTYGPKRHKRTPPGGAAFLAFLAIFSQRRRLRLPHLRRG